MTTDLEDRLRRALHRQAARAPLAAPAWPGPSYVAAVRRRRAWPAVAVAASLIAVLVVGVAVWRGGDGDHGPAAISTLDARPRALPRDLSGWNVVDVVDSTNWSYLPDPAVQLFRRDDGATVRIVTQSTTSSPGPGEAPLSPATTIAATPDLIVPAGAPSGAEALSDVRGGVGAWESLGDGGVVWFTLGDDNVSVQVDGMSRDAALALVESLTGSPGAYDTPTGFTAVGASESESPHMLSWAEASLARAGTTTGDVSIMTSPAPPGRSDIRLDQPLIGVVGRYEGSGSDTRLVAGEDGSTFRSIAWLENGARIVVASATVSMDDLRAIAAATHLVSPATWQAQAQTILEGWQSLPEISRIALDNATIVARGDDPTWPEVLCLEVHDLTRCFRNLESHENSPTAVVGSVILDGWWMIGFAQDGLSTQSGLTTDAGTAALHWARTGAVEWFAVRLPDGATRAQGEISSSSGSGSGGPWFRP